MIKNKITAQEIESANIQPLFEMRNFFSCFFLVGRVGVRAAPAIMGQVRQVGRVGRVGRVRGVRRVARLGGLGRLGGLRRLGGLGRLEGLGNRIFFWFWDDD